MDGSFRKRRATRGVRDERPLRPAQQNTIENKEALRRRYDFTVSLCYEGLPMPLRSTITAVLFGRLRCTADAPLNRRCKLLLVRLSSRPVRLVTIFFAINVCEKFAQNGLLYFDGEKLSDGL